jgi:hypothetical protein
MPEKELDAERALRCVAPIADFAHDPAAELVEPLDDVDDVNCDDILRTNVTILLLCTAIRSNTMLSITLSFFNQLVRISSWALCKRRGKRFGRIFFTAAEEEVEEN